MHGNILIQYVNSSFPVSEMSVSYSGERNRMKKKKKITINIYLKSHLWFYVLEQKLTMTTAHGRYLSMPLCRILKNATFPGRLLSGTVMFFAYRLLVPLFLNVTPDVLYHKNNHSSCEKINHSISFFFFKAPHYQLWKEVEFIKR